MCTATTFIIDQVLWRVKNIESLIMEIPPFSTMEFVTGFTKVRKKVFRCSLYLVEQF